MNAGNRAKPRAPGPEQLWKYCKRCNCWKQRPGDFSKNHRTPDGLQFYCRYCHNRMTKFNQQRRLEDQHIAEKHNGIRSPKKQAARPAATRPSQRSDTPQSPSSSSKAPAFDVINSKIPRQQRTHATYRKDPNPVSAADPCPRNPSALSPSPKRQPSAFQRFKAERSLNSDNGPSRQGSHSSIKRQPMREMSALSRPTAARLHAQASAELMLQANAVLEELEQMKAAEAAAASSEKRSRPMSGTPASSSPQSPSLQSPVPLRSAGSASPPRYTQSQEPEPSRHVRGSSSVAYSHFPEPLQHRSFSAPAHRNRNSLACNPHTLSHSLDQLRQACALEPASSSHKDMPQQQPDQREQLRLTMKAPTMLLHCKVEPSHTEADTLHSLHEGHSHAGKSGSPAAMSTASRSRSAQQPSAAAGSGKNPSVRSGSQAAAALAAVCAAEDAGAEVAVFDPKDKILPAESMAELAQGTDKGFARARLQPAAPETAVLNRGTSLTPARSVVRAMSNPPGLAFHISLLAVMSYAGIDQHVMRVGLLCASSIGTSSSDTSSSDTSSNDSFCI